ncbi:DNA-processing protein DprA [Desulfovibrio sp. OttesenSCG-928-C06]|nr:DNA-processing protein DprA [Desulfovibrio sp. OttesenSCG-928-C06]
MSFSKLSDQQKADLWASLALHQLNGIGATRRKKLVDFFGTPYKAILAVKQWGETGLGIRSTAIEQFERGGWRSEARQAWEAFRACPAGLLLYNDPEYPAHLKEIPDAPLFLSYLGDLELLKNSAIAVVGARDCTREGLDVAKNIVRGLTHAGITTISGMARGIDRVVHLAGLEGVGSTIAVLGSGIDVPSPEGNRDLYEVLSKKALILSEFLPGALPKPQNFPVRNRIISGLSLGVLVVEAAMRSGTLITARHAVEQNRDVFAVPGSTLAETSEGCRDLIRRGAKAVFSAEDILLELMPILKPELLERQNSRNTDASTPSGESSKQASTGQFALKDVEGGILPWTVQTKNVKSKTSEDTCASGVTTSSSVNMAVEIEKLSGPEGSVVKFLLAHDRVHLDELAAELSLEVSSLSGMLAILEIRGLVKRLPGMYYSVV